jgi:hypothetical protein
MEDEQARAQTKNTLDTGGKPEFGIVYGLDDKRIVRLNSFEVYRSCDFFNKVSDAIRHGIYSYKGIPYGAPVAGTGRFIPPVKPQP